MDVIRFFEQPCDERLIRKEGYLAIYCFKGHRTKNEIKNMSIIWHNNLLCDLHGPCWVSGASENFHLVCLKLGEKYRRDWGEAFEVKLKLNTEILSFEKCINIGVNVQRPTVKHTIVISKSKKMEQKCRKLLFRGKK